MAENDAQKLSNDDCILNNFHVFKMAAIMCTYKNNAFQTVKKHKNVGNMINSAAHF